jgi:hypothetical protein
MGSAQPTPAARRAEARRSARRDPDGNARLTGISASLLLPLVLLEVVTVVLGVKSVITLHVVIGLVLVGPVLLKLASVTYRMVSYYRGVSEYQQRGRPSVWRRLLGGALGGFFVLLLASGLVLIVGPSAAHSAARSIHVVSACLVVVLLVAHLSIHLRTAARLASADVRPRSRVRGASSRLIALLASLAIGGALALLLGGHGSTYLHHYYPGYAARQASISARRAPADSGATARAK